MARMPRFVVPGYPHHVTQRGNHRQRTFSPKTIIAITSPWHPNPHARLNRNLGPLPLASGVLSVPEQRDGGDIAAELTTFPNGWLDGAAHVVILIYGFNNDVDETRNAFSCLTSRLPEHFPKCGLVLDDDTSIVVFLNNVLAHDLLKSRKFTCRDQQLISPMNKPTVMCDHSGQVIWRFPKNADRELENS